MTKKLFRTLKITCLCMALTAALPIVSFADETTAAVKEDKMVVRIIHLDENGNPLEEDKQTATEETESSEETTDKEEANADEADSDEEEAAEEEADEAEAELEAAIEVENDLRSEIVTYAPNTGVDCSGFTSYVMRHAAEVELPHSSGGQSRMGRQVSSSEMRPGDIICYGSGKRINHVALYIGNGQIVHASTERTGIKVSRWNYRTPVRIVNVLGD